MKRSADLLLPGRDVQTADEWRLPSSLSLTAEREPLESCLFYTSTLQGAGRTLFHRKAINARARSLLPFITANSVGLDRSHCGIDLLQNDHIEAVPYSSTARAKPIDSNSNFDSWHFIGSWEVFLYQCHENCKLSNLVLPSLFISSYQVSW